MRLLVFVLLSLALVALPVAGLAQAPAPTVPAEPPPVTVDDLVRFALERNPSW